MKPFTCLVVLIALLAIVPCPVLAGVIASSTFSVNNDLDGWTAHELGAGGSDNPITYHASGGNPGGYLSALDFVDGNTWYWNAPAKFLGNVSPAYGGTLTFDIRVHGPNNFFSAADVRLVGGGITLVYNAPNNPAIDNPWTSYTVSLLSTASGWHKTNLTGNAPTQAEFQTVLASLTDLMIRGEYITGQTADVGDLDNVFLNAVPEPSALALLGLGVAGLVGWRRHKAA